MEQRLLLAFLLMGLVLFLTPYIYKAPPPPPKNTATPPGDPAQSAKSTQAAPSAAKTAAVPEAGTPAPPSAPVPGQIKGASEQQFEVDTDIIASPFRIAVGRCEVGY